MERQPALWLLVQCREAMGDKLTVEDPCAFGQSDAAQFTGRGGGAYAHNRRSHEAQALFDRPFQQRQVTELLDGRSGPMQRLIEFIEERSRNVRMLVEQEERPGQGFP